MDKKKTVAFGFLGTRLDAGSRERRWQRWRPTLDLCRQPELGITRLELFAERSHRALSERVLADVAEVAPRVEVRLHELGLEDPWDFEEVYAALFRFARDYPFKSAREDYLVHMTTGTHVAQIVWFLLCEARRIPARLLQTAPPARPPKGARAREFLKAGIETRNRARSRS